MIINMGIFFLIAFISMLFYGIVTLLPARSARRKKQKRKVTKVVDSIVVIIISMSGLLMMFFAFIVQNKTAQTIYAQFQKYSIILGLILCAIEIITKIIGKGKKIMKSDKSIFIDDIEIVYGITTPEIFNESKYQVAYETVVQEPEIPFITCELQTLKDNKYIGDIIFEGNKSRISNKELKSMPISEIHLDKLT